MANIQVKRSTSKIAPDAALLAGEIAQSLVSNTSKYLYVSDGTNQLAVGSADVVKYYQPPVVSTVDTAPSITATITSISGTGTVTVDTSAAHGLETGQTVTITGTTNFNGTFVITVSDTDTFTYSDAGNGTPESSGTVTAKPNAGNRYIVGTSPSGWGSGRTQETWTSTVIAAGDIVESDGTNWVITADASAIGNGLTVYDLAASTLKTRTSGSWQTQDATTTLQEAYTNSTNGSITETASVGGIKLATSTNDISASTNTDVLKIHVESGGTANTGLYVHNQGAVTGGLVNVQNAAAISSLAAIGLFNNTVAQTQGSVLRGVSSADIDYVTSALLSGTAAAVGVTTALNTSTGLVGPVALFQNNANATSLTAVITGIQNNASVSKPVLLLSQTGSGAEIKFGGVASDRAAATAGDGGIWWNTTDNKFRYSDATNVRTVANLEEDQTFSGAITTSGGITTSSGGDITVTGGSSALNLQSSATMTADSGTTVTINGTLAAASATAVTVPTPTSSNHATTKAYVDSIAAGIDVKASVRVATAATLTLTTDYTRAGSGASHILTASSNGVLSIDGINTSWVDIDNDSASADPFAASPASRVLIKNASDPVDNGIYAVKDKGSGGTPWKLIRAADQNGDPSNEVSGGNFTFVEQGTSNQDTGWVVTSNATITVDTDSIAWSQFTGAGSFTAGNGIGQSGATIFLDINEMSATNIASGDFLAFADISDSNNGKKISAQNFLTDLNLWTTSNAVFGTVKADSLKLEDTDSAFLTIVQSTSTNTADRTLTIDMNDASRTLSLGGDLSTSGGNITLTVDETTAINLSSSSTGSIIYKTGAGAWADSGTTFASGVLNSISAGALLWASSANTISAYTTAPSAVASGLQDGVLVYDTGTNAIAWTTTIDAGLF